MDRSALRGRLHGRLLLVLIVVAVLASAAAVWQFSTLWDDPDPDLAEIDGRETPAPPAPSGDPDSSSATASPSPSPSLESSPVEEGTTTAAAAVTRSAAPTEAAAGPACTASLTLNNDWSESISVTVTVANTGTERVDGWEVLLALEDLEVTSTWGLRYIEGDRYGDILFNAALDPGDSVEPTFEADVEGDYTLPATVPCTPA
jgi:cellulase/cellobiase CelA1